MTKVMEILLAVALQDRYYVYFGVIVLESIAFAFNNLPELLYCYAQVIINKIFLPI